MISSQQHEQHRSSTSSLINSIEKIQELILSQQWPDGYWWYTLEANESINAEFILLIYFFKLEKKYEKLIQAIGKRILNQQSEDGSWGIFYKAQGDLSTTIECYWVLKLLGYSIHSEELYKARCFILSQGGIPASRVFTKIHLAIFNLIPWDACPEMPIGFLLLPKALKINIYEFSSWARACLVPLLILTEKKVRHPLPNFNLDELYHAHVTKKDWQFKTPRNTISFENLFIFIDKTLKRFYQKIPRETLNKLAFQKAEQWILEHVSKTEDIYPALAYSMMALHALGHSLEHPQIQKCFNALLSFQQESEQNLEALPQKHFLLPENIPSPSLADEKIIYQQCCISPVWDTPWACMALLESQLHPAHPKLISAAQWLLSKQITETYGDWSIKNKKAEPGGWSFEFENEYFPDVDDSIEVLLFLLKVEMPKQDFAVAFQRGLSWILSMQSKNGGWAAFDKDNLSAWVNKIPFSDHGACLDPPTADITGRALELLGNIGYSKDNPICKKALKFIFKQQDKNGGWMGRWGVNYLYGTWCVLQGLQAMGIGQNHIATKEAVYFLKRSQHEDGGWSESCDSYQYNKFISLKDSTASQTAWAVMGLMAMGEWNSVEVKRGIEFLINTQNADGSWTEPYHTGTGFPGHFYIRYHGYRHYFPLLCLGKYRKMCETE